MKIFSIPNYQINKRVQNNKMYSVPFAPRIKAPLSVDTVSFKMAPNTGRDIIEHQIGKKINSKAMQNLANTFLRILDSIALELKDLGIEFIKAYSEKSCIKSKDAWMSKIMRSGKLRIPDGIRATLFCKNAYDLSILKKIIEMLESCNYEIVEIEHPISKAALFNHIPTKTETKNGIFKVKDIDIRFDKNDITNSLPEFTNYISKPQKSGYEDIQIRFVNKTDKRKIQHELIIIPGKNYARAKHYESEKIYKYTRMLDELNFYKNTKDEESRNKIQVNIDSIKFILNLEISQKLFKSAKNADVYNINNNLLISLSEQDITQIKKYFAALKTECKKYYDSIEKRAKTPKRTNYIKKKHEEDTKLLTQIQKNILESIEFFNEKKYLKNLDDLDCLQNKP